MSKKWDWHDIKAALHKRGMTLTRLAELNGLDRTTCRVVGSRVNRKGEAAISAFLDVPVEDLFPDRYPVRSSSILSSKYEGRAASPKAVVNSDIGGRP